MGKERRYIKNNYKNMKIKMRIKKEVPEEACGIFFSIFK
jgi:hypothetical protein